MQNCSKPILVNGPTSTKFTRKLGTGQHWRFLKTLTLIYFFLELHAAGQFDLAIIVSGTRQRFIPESIQTLARNVVAAQIHQGFTVDVFAVLQEGHSNKRYHSANWTLVTHRYADQRSEFMRALTSAGAQHKHFASYDKPTIKQLNEYFPVNMTMLRDGRYGRRTTRRKVQFDRNMCMLQNLYMSYITLRAHELNARQGRPYDIYVRTRSDNYFFSPHLSYQGFVGKRASVITPKCDSRGGIYDKFMLFTNSFVADLFFNVFHGGFKQIWEWNILHVGIRSLWELDVSRSVYNAEMLWMTLFKTNAVAVHTVAATSMPLAHVAYHQSLNFSTELCFREMCGIRGHQTAAKSVC
jgi:hypothetical protein